MGPLKPYIEPDAGRRPQADGPDETLAILSVPCGSCGVSNRFNAAALIDRSRAWLPTLDDDALERLRVAFDCTVRRAGTHVSLGYRKEPAYCAVIDCEACGTPFVACMQFYERQPTRYITTLIGAATFDGRDDPRPGPVARGGIVTRGNLGLTNYFLKSGFALIVLAIAVLLWTLLAPGSINYLRGWLFGYLFWSGVVLYVIGRFAGRARTGRESAARRGIAAGDDTAGGTGGARR